jgi:hypothetical protein
MVAVVAWGGVEPTAEGAVHGFGGAEAAGLGDLFDPVTSRICAESKVTITTPGSFTGCPRIQRRRVVDGWHRQQRVPVTLGPRPHAEVMKVAHGLYPGFTALDVVGAFRVFAGAPGVDPVFVALEPGPVVDDSGHCPLQAMEGVADVMAADVVVVPGSDDDSERMARCWRGCSFCTPPRPGPRGWAPDRSTSPRQAFSRAARQRRTGHRRRSCACSASGTATSGSSARENHHRRGQLRRHRHGPDPGGSHPRPHGHPSGAGQPVRPRTPFDAGSPAKAPAQIGSSCTPTTHHRS